MIPGSVVGNDAVLWSYEGERLATVLGIAIPVLASSREGWAFSFAVLKNHFRSHCVSDVRMSISQRRSRSATKRGGDVWFVF